MEERTLKLAQDHIALLTESFEARGVYVSELQAQVATLTAERDAALARLADIVTTLEARYDWSKMPLDDPLGLLLRQFDTDGVWIGEVEG